MASDDFRHLFVHRLHYRPNLLRVAALVLFRLFQGNTSVARQRQGDMVPASGFIGGVSHLALFDDGNAGSAAANIHHACIIKRQQIRHRRRFIQYVADF